MPLEMASNNARTSSLFHDISEGKKEVHVTLKTAVQNRQQNRDRVKIEEGLLRCSFDSKLRDVGYRKSP
jgi:hypothetical protein